MLLVEQCPDLQMRTGYFRSLFLGSLYHLLNVQIPCCFDLGESEHGAQLKNMWAEALHVIPFLLGRDGKAWAGEHGAVLASCLGVYPPIRGLLLALVVQKAKQRRIHCSHSQAGCRPCCTAYLLFHTVPTALHSAVVVGSAYLGVRKRVVSSLPGPILLEQVCGARFIVRS